MIEDILKKARTIAVVGISRNRQTASFRVMSYLSGNGYTVFPVNPKYEDIERHACYPDLVSIPVKIDIVNIFRRPEDVSSVVDDAIKIGAGVVWMQLGIVNEEAATRAKNAGLTVVMNQCIKVQHQLMTNAAFSS